MKIRDFRRVQGLTQRDVARLAGTSQITVCKIERGQLKADIPAARRIAAVLGIEQLADEQKRSR